MAGQNPLSLTFASIRKWAAPVFPVAAFLSLASFAPSSLFKPVPFVPTATVRATSIPLDAESPSRTRLGRLRFLQGWVLRSDNPHFGGISAMHVADGMVTGLSDAGWTIRFRLPSGKSAIAAQLKPLADGPGSSDQKRDRDSESMLVQGRTGWIGFERQNAVWRYSTVDWKSDSHSAPAAMRNWPENSGAEAMVRLADGRFLIFSEDTPYRDGTTEVLLFDGDPAVPGTAVRKLGYRVPPGYSVTDAALLPDGRLLVLHRRFAILEGVSAKLVVAPLPKLGEGAVISGKEIAELRPPVNVDNMEALSVTSEKGRVIVWIASDDNFNPIQRTLLMKFALD